MTEPIAGHNDYSTAATATELPNSRLEEMFAYISRKLDDQSGAIKELSGRVLTLEEITSPPKRTPMRANMKDDIGNYDTLDTNFGFNFRPPRRETLYETVTSRHISNEVTPIMQRSLPSYNHIKLQFLRLDDAIDFVDQIYQYELEHRVKLPIHSLLGVNVRELLMAEIGLGVTEQKFYTIPREEVISAIRENVKPRSKPTFVRALKKKIELNWPNGYEPSPVNFKIAYERYLIYRNKWIKRYDFMKENNPANIPECRDSDDGLIAIFLKGINNFYYPSVLYTRIPYDEKKTFRGPDGFQRFLDSFYALMKDDYDRYKAALELYENIKSDKSTEKREPESHSKPIGKSPYVSRPKPLHMFLDETPAKDINEEETNQSEPATVSTPLEDYFEREDTSSPPEIVTHEEIAAENYALLPPDKGVAPCCFQKLFLGQCNRKTCSYLHTSEALMKGFYFYADCLKKSPLRPQEFHIGFLKDHKVPYKEPVIPKPQRPGNSPNVLKSLSAVDTST
jgi:hypothetical protein